MLAIIPARGGSKGLPGKNIRPLKGRPLIDYAIRAALDARAISRVVVSTDSEEIAAIARQCGAEVPFLRPPELATDSARAIDTYLYTIERLEKEDGLRVDTFCVLQPTSPLRNAEDVDGAVGVFLRHSAHSVIAVKEMPHPVEWTRVIAEGGVIREHPAFTSDDNDNRQRYSKAYVPNGAIFVFDVASLRAADGSYYTDRTWPWVMPAWRSVDIDTLEDLELAAFWLEKQGGLG